MRRWSCSTPPIARLTMPSRTVHPTAREPTKSQTGTEGDIMNRDQYATSAEFVGYAKHDAEGNLTVGSSDGTVTLNPASTTPRAAGNSWWQDRKVCVYVRRSVWDLSVIEVHMVCDARLAHEEAEEQRLQAEQYPLGSKQYWRGELVGKAVDLTGERVMTNEDFDAEWTGDPDTLDWILDR